MTMSASRLLHNYFRSPGLRQRYINRLAWSQSQYSTTVELSVPQVTVNLELRQQSLQNLHPKADSILKYWLGDNYGTIIQEQLPEDKITKKWFSGGEIVDKEVQQLFGEDVVAVENGQYEEWKENPIGALALLVLMDQFTRNIYRGNKKTFCLDSRALLLSKSIIRSGMIDALLPIERLFVMLPFEHSESLQDQQLGIAFLEAQIEYCEALGDKNKVQEFLKFCLNYAMLHLDVIAKWSRFPHRNQVLERESTPEELEGLQNGTIPKFG